MEKSVKAASAPKKRKRVLKTKITTSEAKTPKLEETPILTQNASVQKTPMPKVMYEGLSMEEIGKKYPVLKNQDLVDKFLNVKMTNNQKGRIRQLVRDNLKGTADVLLPDVIHNRIQLILKSSENLTDTDLRKIRILYNMLNTAVKSDTKIEQKKGKKKKNVIEEDGADMKEKIKVKKEKENIKDTDVKKEQIEKKVKGPKRYVVFLGNLPLDIDKEKIMSHFTELNEHIKDIRIPKTKEGKKSAIAYVELGNEPTYELALSKHHSMMGNKRINVLYTAQKFGKITKAEAKGKSAKLIALQKSGKLIGSIPLNKKRSHRRMKMKQARAKEAAENA